MPPGRHNIPLRGAVPATVYHVKTWGTGGPSHQWILIVEQRCAVSEAADEGRSERLIAVRDSKDPEGPKLFFSVSAWRDFLDRIKAGKHELPEEMREELDERFVV